MLSYAEIIRIGLSSEQVAKSKTDAVLIFGVLGGLAAKSSHDRTTLSVDIGDDETAYYEVNGSSITEVKSRVAPIMKTVGIPIVGGLEHQPERSTDIAGQLRELATLRQQGMLSEEEFEAAKAKLLS